jgi:hypothetical protein
MKLRILLLGGLAAGAAGGAIAAVAIPQTTAVRAIAPAPAPAVTPAAVGVRRVAARRMPPVRGDVQWRPRGPAHIAVRVADPRGGPPWAVRTFFAERVVPARHGGGESRVVGHSRCVQLGRVYRGRFGWLTADGTFRAVARSYRGAPIQCVSRRADAAGRPVAEVVTTITEPERAAAEPVQTVLYGVAGPAARDLRLDVGGRAVALRHGSGGSLLALLAPGTPQSAPRLTARYPRRGSVTILPLSFGGHYAPGAAHPRRDLAPELTAQAPDPDGGLPFGMAVTRGSDGDLCTKLEGRVVGDRVGSVDYELDLLRVEQPPPAGCPLSQAVARGAPAPVGRRPPFTLEIAIGGRAELPGADPAAGRVARRSLPGRVTYSGIADADVRHLTFATPSDVRTIAPTGPAHAFVIVYAGTFPTGTVTITTTFRDGHTRRDRFPTSGL